MMKKIKRTTITLLVGVAITLIGCDRNPSRQLTNGFVNDLNAFLKEQQIHYYCLVNNLDFSSTENPPRYRCENPPKSLDETQKQQKEQEATRIRNDFIERSTLVIDANYEEFIAALGEGRSQGNFIADIIELGTSAVIGIVDNVNTLQILGVSLTAFRGARSSYDLNFYEKQTTPILINMMDTGRNRVYQVIIQKKERSTANYSLTEAMKDVVAYYNAGTLIRAFAELSKDAAIQSRISEEEVLRLQGVQVSPLATQPAVDSSIRALNVLRQLAKDLKDESKKERATQKLQEIVAILEKSPEFKELNFKSISSGEENGRKILDGLIEIRKNAANDLSKYSTFLDTIETTIIK